MGGCGIALERRAIENGHSVNCDRVVEVRVELHSWPNTESIPVQGDGSSKGYSPAHCQPCMSFTSTLLNMLP